MTAAIWAQLKLATKTAALPSPWATRDKQMDDMVGVVMMEVM